MTAFFSVFFILIIMSVLMWGFFRFMYPKPPKAFMPKAGDVITPRECSLCGYPLAEYRGVLEAKPESALDESQQAEIAQLTAEIDALRQALDKQKHALFGSADSHDEMSKAGDSGVQAMTRKQRKQAKQAYDAQQQQLFERQQALKKMTTWFFCNYDHQAEFHGQSPSSQSQSAAVE